MIFLINTYFLIPLSAENNFIYLSIRQGIKYKIIGSGVVSVYSSIIYIHTFFFDFHNYTTWLTAQIGWTWPNCLICNKMHKTVLYIYCSLFFFLVLDSFSDQNWSFKFLHKTAFAVDWKVSAQDGYVVLHWSISFDHPVGKQ